MEIFIHMLQQIVLGFSIACLILFVILVVRSAKKVSDPFFDQITEFRNDFN